MNSLALFILFALQLGKNVEAIAMDAFAQVGARHCFDGPSDYTATTEYVEDCAQLCFEYGDCLVFQWKAVDQICLMSKTPINVEHMPYECLESDLYKKNGFVVWGSFTSDSLTDASSALTTYNGYHDTLRTLISQASGTIAEPTQTLTDEYLSGIDIFFTSRIERGLSIMEQSALQDWVLDGGVLIVASHTASSVPSSPWYMTFTQMFGLITTGFLSSYGGTTLSVPDSSIHPILTGVGSFRDYSIGTFSVEDYVDVLVEYDGYPVVAVLEGVGPGCGSVLVCGWHSVYDGFISEQDNFRYMENIVQWAHGKHGVDPPLPDVPRISLQDLDSCDETVIL